MTLLSHSKSLFACFISLISSELVRGIYDLFLSYVAA